MTNDVAQVRNALLAALPLETSNYGEIPDARSLYVPPAHVQALRLECNLVVGARGVGKSFWTAALQSEDLRQTLDPTIRGLSRTKVAIGFSNKEQIGAYPNADVFSQLLGKSYVPYDIWRAVILRRLMSLTGDTESSGSTWREYIDQIKKDPEKAANFIEQTNNNLSYNNNIALIVFDALDRTSDDWRRMDEIVRGLLRAVLWLKSFSHIHAKVFLRADQAERTVTDFPDASKLLATRVDLTWARHDLHGLLWHRLINAPDQSGKDLRALYRDVSGAEPILRNDAYQLADAAKRETDTQKNLFARLAGEQMGQDRRRGVPYTWSVGHLADGRGQTSPRSFLAAIRQAVEDSEDRYTEHPTPIHYESIKRGVQKASQIRVEEIAEDYPWIRTFLSCLSGLNVPCDYSVFRDRWEKEFPNGPNSAPRTDRLPPQHADRGWDGIADDLIRLGLIEKKKDGRIDMPDLYRVGFGLGRKGGVKPQTQRS